MVATNAHASLDTADETAVIQLHDAHGAALYDFARHLGLSDEQAADALQLLYSAWVSGRPGRELIARPLDPSAEPVVIQEGIDPSGENRSWGRLPQPGDVELRLEQRAWGLGGWHRSPSMATTRRLMETAPIGPLSPS